jgi:glutamate-1-semialdehyde 2,1-aminomutase
VLPYNDAEALENLFQKQGINIAAVIVEPVAGNMGVVAPNSDFLKALDALTKRHGALLIFDEVMTGFRLDWGGAQTLFSMMSDLTCLGKIIGGGFPVGAFGGRRDIMEMLAPLGPVYQAGTLSGNPVAMSAGVATLLALKNEKPYNKLAKAAKDLAEFMRGVAAKLQLPLQVNQVGSMFTVFFSDQPVTSYFTATQSDVKQYAAFFHALLERGVYFPPSQFEAAFISTAHSPLVMEKTKKAFAHALEVVAKGR